MIKNRFLFGLFMALVLLSCGEEKDEPTPLPVADFEVTVAGQAPTATITIVNKSTDASQFTWTFGEGASIRESSDKTPATITVDKAGELTITLEASNGVDKSSKELKVAVGGFNALVTFSNIEFGLTAGDATYGRLFSFEDGKIYKDSEINATTGPKIGLAFGQMANTLYYFESPAVAAYNVPGAKVTKVTNFPSPVPFSVTEFDGMTDDSKLKGLTIENTDDSFGNSSIPGIVLFQLSSGLKGAVRTKSVSNQRILVDIKIQKYSGS